jgi:hypothetical protein
MAKKKNAGRYSVRKSKKRSAAAYKRLTGKAPARKRVKRSSRSKQRKNSALKPISKSTGWKNAPGGSQVKFKRNKGKIEVYLRSKPRRKTTTKRRK